MNSVVWLLMVTCISGSLAGILPVNPGGIGGLFRGPNSETIIRGPDGSEITSEQIGGNVQIEPRLEPIIVPDYQDDQIAASSVTASPVETISISNNIEGVSPTPIAASSQISGVNPQIYPIPAATLPQEIPLQASVPIATALALPAHATTAEEPHIIETELVDAPDVEPNQSSDLKGPSGSITVRGSSSIISGPSSTTISEPVRKLPIATVPIAAPPPAVPSAILIPPSPSVNVATINDASTNFASNVQYTSNQNSVPSSPPNVQIPWNSPTYNLQPPAYPSLNTELVPPPVPSSQTSLSETSGTGFADASLIPPQTQSVSSTPIPPESLPPNAIDLGQTIVSTTQRSTVAPSSGDVDGSRINLGQTNNAQQFIGLSAVQSDLVSSTVPPINVLNTGLSTPATVSSLQTSLIAQPGRGISLSGDRPLFTTVSDIQPTSSGSDSIFTPSRDGRIYSQDQSIITNQIISNTARPTVDGSNVIGSTRAPTIDVQNNIPSRPWLQVEPDHILPTGSSSFNAGLGGPISTILDTVLVQPTDPKNREVIEFGGKQLENVGNIVPVLHQPVIVAGGLTSIHNIPTASVSQLASRNDFNTNYDPNFNRYE